MLKAFWTWDPVSSGTYRAFDEPHAYANNKWFFDKSVWQRMFRSMNSCGFNAMILANTHPFPFMIDIAAYPDAKVIDDATLLDYQRMHHWIFETARDYDIAPHLFFMGIYYPEKLLQARGIKPADMATPTDFALEYTNYCTRGTLENYPDLAGLFVDAGDGQNDNGPECASRTQFLQQAIVDAVDAARPDISLYVRGWCGDADSFVENIQRRGGRSVNFSVKYTHDYLVDQDPDPMFTHWIDAAGAANVAAEFWFSNFQPWTSFSYETVEGILSNLQDLGCDDFSVQPLSLYEWPQTSDTFFKFQFQRDFVWYSAWGGISADRLLKQGTPKWLVRNSRLLPGFAAGSRILELLALYFAGDKRGSWRPQFCSVRDPGSASTRLLSIEDMLHLDDQPAFDGLHWWTEITGDTVIHLAEYLESGTPEDAYGPDEFIEELADLASQAVAAGEKGMRSASGEKELPSFARDALCMGRLGEFYVERLKAALSHARGDAVEAGEHLARALGFYREIVAVDSSHRCPFRVVSGHGAIESDWSDTLGALEAEYDDASKGEFKRGVDYPISKSVAVA